MDKKDFEYVLGALNDLSLYVYGCMEKANTNPNGKALNNKRLFNFDRIPPDEHERTQIAQLLENMSGRTSDQPAPSRSNVAKQLNKMGKKINSNFTGEPELIKLKHGQGSISLKIRYNKNGTVYKIYQGRYYNEYGKLVSVYGKTQAECLQKLKQAHPVKKNQPARKVYPTFQEWMLAWYNDFKKNTIRTSVQRNYEAQMNTYIFPALGKIRLPSLSAETLQHFFKKFESGNTRKKLFLLISASLKKAVVLKKIQFNPCDAVELPKYKKKKRRPFEYEEQNKILSENNDVAQAFFFLCATGLRASEFLALTKDDFYFDQHVFKVDKALVQGNIEDPKSESGNRTVYFIDELFDYFDINLLGTFTYSSLSKGLKRLINKHQIKGVSLHCTRHTYATICHSFGLNDKTLQSQLGHATLAMTQDVYTHLLKKGPSKIRDYLDKLCTHIRTHN